jgi:hypothetical protein
MQRVLLQLVCLLALIPAEVNASLDYIGLFSTPDGAECSAEIQPGSNTTIYILAIVPNHAEEGITAAEFAVDGLPTSGYEEGGYWNVTWSSDLIIGEIELGVAIAFSNPVQGEVVELGQIHFNPITDNWVEADSMLEVVESWDAGYIAIVDHEYEIYLVLGGECTLNCSPGVNCDCDRPGFNLIPPELIWGNISPGNFEDKRFEIVNNSNDEVNGSLSSDSPHFVLPWDDGDYAIPPFSSQEIIVRFLPDVEGEFQGVISTGCLLCEDLYCIGYSDQLCSLIGENPADLGEVEIGDYAVSSSTVWNSSIGEETLYLHLGENSEHLTILNSDWSHALPPGDSLSIEYAYHPMDLGPHLLEIELGNYNNCGQYIVSGEGVHEIDSHIDTNHIGLYLYPNASGCESELQDVQTVWLKLIAVLPDLSSYHPTEAEFRLAHLPTEGWGEIYVDWENNVEVLEGDLWDGIHLRFRNPLDSGINQLARIRFSSMNGEFPPELPLTPAPRLDNQAMRFILSNQNDMELLGSSFQFNCVEGQECPCGIFDSPVEALWPRSLDYWLVTVGETVTRQIIVRNDGGGNVSGNISMPPGPFHVQEGSGPFSLASGDSLIVTIDFTPTEVGPITENLETGLSSFPQVECTGFGDGPPVCVIEPATLDFGDFHVGDSGEMSLVIRNEGGTVLSGIVGMEENPNFNIIEGAGPYELTRYMERDILVSFHPSESGQFSTELMLDSEDCPDAVTVVGRARPYTPFPDLIGVFSDLLATECDMDIASGNIDTLYIVSFAPAFAELGVRGARFGIEGLPEIGSEGTWDIEWEADQVSGDLDTGWAISFDETILGDSHLLGRILLDPFDSNWVGENHEVRIRAFQDDDSPLIIGAEDLAWPVEGHGSTLNCEPAGDCNCPNSQTPVCAIYPVELYFGHSRLYEWKTKAIEITNDGYGYLSGDPHIEGDQYWIHDGGGPFQLGPQESHTISVSFRALTTEQYDGTLYTGVESCPSVPLSGYGSDSPPSNIYLGCYADDEYYYCAADIEPYVPTTIYIALNVGNRQVSSVNFKLDNLPENLGYPTGVIEEHWNGTVIGDPWSGMTLEFPTPQEGHFVDLGRLEFIAFTEDWVEVDHEVETVGTGDLSQHPVYYDEHGFPHIAAGLTFTFNCTHYYDCECFSGHSPVFQVNSFELEEAPGLVTASWDYDLGDTVEFKLLASRETQTWDVPHVEFLPGSYEAQDDSEAIREGGIFVYELLGRIDEGEWLKVEEENVTVHPMPIPTQLHQPFPNPFNPTVTLSLSIGTTGRARLSIVDVTGRRIRTLEDREFEAGHYDFMWDGFDDKRQEISSGVYFVYLETGGEAISKKLVLIR